MPEWSTIAILMMIIVFSSGISTATGFGAVVLALPLCSLVLDVKTVIPLLALTSTVTCTFMTVREHESVDWRELRKIFFWLGIAFPVGNLGYHYLSIKMLEIMLGTFVTGIALHGFWRLLRGMPNHEWTKSAGIIILLWAGLIQGSLASSGPLVVTYARHAIQDRRKFRASLFVIWMIFNGIFTLSSFIGKTSQPYVALLGVMCLPALAVGIWIGQFVHHKASDRFFQVLVLAILLLSGTTLLLPRHHHADSSQIKTAPAQR